MTPPDEYRHDELAFGDSPEGLDVQRHATFDDTGIVLVWAGACTGVAVGPGQILAVERDEDGAIVAYNVFGDQEAPPSTPDDETPGSPGDDSTPPPEPSDDAPPPPEPEAEADDPTPDETPGGTGDETPAADPDELRCEECDRTFANLAGLNGHNAAKHAS